MWQEPGAFDAFDCAPWSLPGWARPCTPAEPSANKLFLNNDRGSLERVIGACMSKTPRPRLPDVQKGNHFCAQVRRKRKREKWPRMKWPRMKRKWAG
eukprot:6178219-Pleurochrysis_carterae.AAC.5